MTPLILQFKKVTPLYLTIFMLGCFAFSPQMQALSPPPDGGYPNGNTAEGDSALAGLTTGSFNSAFGFLSLLSNGSASFNTGVGAGALLLNSASENTATGAGALFSTTSGGDNAADGAFALFSNVDGLRNNAVGSNALVLHTTGNFNNAVGAFALSSDTSGVSNDAFGDGALSSNTTGLNNTAARDSALTFNTTGNANTAFGFAALLHNTTGIGNIALGFDAGINVTTANNVTCINHVGQNVSSTTWVSNVFGVATQSGTTAPVIVSDSGQLGTVVSSERFKKDIATMDKASEAILSLRPVTFHYKTDTKSTPQFGLIAEDVAKVNPSLVIPDKEGKPYTVRYDQVNAMLLNEFLKEHKAFLEEHRTVEELKKEVAALRAGLQKVSAQLEASKPAPQVADSNY